MDAMNGGSHTVPGAGAAALPRGAGALAGSALALLLALPAVTLIEREGPPLDLVLVAGLGLLALLALALVSYQAAAALGFLLLAAVNVEPAPCDAVLAVVIAVALATGRFDLRRAPRQVLALLAALIALNVASAVDVVDVGLAARFFGVTLYLALFALWLTSYVDSGARSRSLVRAYLAGAVITAALSAVALFAPFPGSDVLVDEGARARGLFKDPNVFGPFLILAFLILLDDLFTPRLLRAGARAKVAALVVLMLGVFLSYSRAAWLNLVIGLLVMLLVYSLRRGAGRRLTALVALLLVAASTIVAVVAVTGSTSFFEERARLQAYDAERFGTQRSLLTVARANPLGIGPGQVDAVSQLSAHSSYVRALAEQGPLGFLAFASLLAVTLVLAARNVARGRDTFGIGSAALLAAWCGLLANSAFVDTLHWRHLWLVAALVWVGAGTR
jgi:O-antigen ligase